MTDKFLSKLSQNFLEILDDDEYYDITIEVGNDPHKNDETLLYIKLPNILPEIFQIILRYIYGGKISLVEYDTLDIIKILVAANELSLQELVPHLQSFLIENKENWIEQNFNLIYQTSFGNDSFLDLQKFCTELISKQPEKIFNSSSFTSISEKVLISLIQLDKVQMSEVQIWEHVLKWGIAQNPELSLDPSSYSNDDFNALKNTLQQFIPLIKFTEFASKEFLSKVYPYRKIISEDLYENLIQCFLDNDYKPSKKSEQQTIKETRKINNYYSYGPSFGREDLKFREGFESSYNKRASYEKQIRETEDVFSVEEYEVFQIVRDN
ncbi:BTB/POZ protein [Rhizophagus irregularis DAOM 181602=DAOM 197198]|nr:BTB/POZ protein [Rhizophagus irregularis DAOM 181602=DAOM 197198]